MKKPEELSIGIFTFSKKHFRSIEKCGSSIWRGMWYWNNWPQAEEYVEGKQYDVVIFQKVWQEDLYLELAKREDVLVILDLCDPEWIMGNWPIMKISSLIDGIVVSSKGLEIALKQMGVLCPVIWINDRVDTSFFKVRRRKEHSGEIKQAVWFGYRGNGESALQPVLPYLMMNNIKLTTLSDNPLIFPEYEYNMSNKEFKWEQLPFDLLEADVLLNPMTMSPLAKYKSDNKTYLGWTFGLPVVKTNDDLQKYMDGTEREQESVRVYNLVDNELNVKKSIEEYKSFIKMLWEKKTQSK